MRWQSRGQSCIKPSMRTLLSVSLTFPPKVLRIVFIEAATRLLAKAPLFDISAEQGAGSFRRVPLRRCVVLLDIQHDVQSDLVHQSKWRLRSAKDRLEDTIDVTGCGNTVRNDPKRLALDSFPNPVENETYALTLNVIGLQSKSWQDLN